MKSNLLLLAILLSMVIFYSCKKNDDSNENNSKTEVKENYAVIVFANYEDSYNAVVELQNKINAFVDNPTQSGFDDAKDAWYEAREPYGQTEAFRFANGPIDDADGPEGLMNAWPLDEAHIDYVVNGTGNDDNTSANIINDTVTFPSITEQVLLDQNENPGEKNIATGYHAIEFLLWGQDIDMPSALTKGHRPYTDYLTDGNRTANNQMRRCDYLKAAVSLLVKNSESMKDEWDPSKSGNYRETFLTLKDDVALSYMLTAIGVLSKSELAGERMFTALDNQDQEDEHSCFSDNTHRDIIMNAQGIRNVYTGEYKRTDGSTISGTSIQDLIADADATIAEEMNTLSLQSITNVKAIPVPFDNALTQEAVGGSGPIMTAVRTLQDQGDKIAEVAQALGLTISTDLPE